MYKSSRAALLVCCLLLMAASSYYPKWKQQAAEATISWDVAGYYMYLPATFIYHDLKKCGFADSILRKYKPTPDFQQAFLHSSGNYVMKYTMGQAVVFSPFFFAAQILTQFTSYPADGFSLPYQLCISFGMMLYAFIGLWFLRKILIRFFPDTIVAITLLIITFATNYLNYAAIDGGMTHNTLFTLYSSLLFATLQLFETGRFRFFIAVGFVAGLLTLIRPTEIICLLIPTLWGISSGADLKKRKAFIIGHYKYFFVLIGCFLLTILPQFMYWKWASGDWFVHTYGQEGFDWLRPHIIKGLISYRAGWLVYTPAMILSITGFVFLYRSYRSVFWSTAIFGVCFLYICFSWREWWYGASLGQRAIIQSYPVLCLPLAALLDAVRKKNKIVLTGLIACFIITCVFYNLWLTHQAHRGGLFMGGQTTRSYFWASLGRWQVPKETLTLLDNKEVFRGDTGKAVEIFSMPREQRLDKDTQSTHDLFFMTHPGKKWLRARAIFSTPQKEWDVWKMPQFNIKFYRGTDLCKVNFIRVSRVLGDGETAMLHFDASIPDSCTKASVSVWNAGSEKQLIIKNITVSEW
ncbi:MAG: hypothetical protein ABI581_05565 [Sediminibacterium sp.]